MARVHTFYLHAHGLALVVFVLSLIIANMDLLLRTQRVLLGLVCLGLLYLFGWLRMVFALPFYGRSGAFRLVEKNILYPPRWAIPVGRLGPDPALFPPTYQI